jgi:hypothetical protein
VPKQIEETTFTMELPSEFQVTKEANEIQCVCLDPPGVLRLTPEEVEDTNSLPNLSRMLAGFLTRTGHPVATDELLRVTSVPEAHGFSWQYTEDGNYHRLWLFGNRRSWLLVTFVCPKAEQQNFHETLQSLIKTLRLRADEPDS